MLEFGRSSRKVVVLIGTTALLVFGIFAFLRSVQSPDLNQFKFMKGAQPWGWGIQKSNLPHLPDQYFEAHGLSIPALDLIADAAVELRADGWATVIYDRPTGIAMFTKDSASISIFDIVRNKKASERNSESTYVLYRRPARWKDRVRVWMRGLNWRL